MNEIRHIHLGRQAYTISADAYKDLHDYLDAIKHGTGKDVAEEVELRISELLTERGITAEKVILSKDVTYLKEQLGTPGDFSEDQSDADAMVEINGTPKRLFRDTDDAMVAGVAAGLAKYLNTDVIIVRLIFIALAFFGGSGILLYILLWLLVPEAKTNSQRLQMRGMAVNVENIKEAIAEADVPGATRRVSGLVVKVIGIFLRVVLIIIGVAFIIGGIAVVIGSAILAVYGLARGVQINDVTLFPIGKEQLAVVLCGFVALTLSAGMLAASGVALVRRKWAMPGWAIAAVIVTFIVATSVGIGLGFDVAPVVRSRYQSLDRHRTYTMQPINNIRILGDNAIYRVTQGDSPEVDIHTVGKADTRKIAVTEQNGLLTIDTTKFDARMGCNFVCPYASRQAEITIYAPNTYAIPVEAPANAGLALDNSGITYQINPLHGGDTILAIPTPPTTSTNPL